MTKTEAIQATKEGKKVTHRYFSNDEYLYRDNSGILRTEEGYPVKPEFWSYRTDASWDSDWSVYEG